MYVCMYVSVCVCVCVCVCVILVIQQAIRVLPIVICGLPALQHFSTLSHTRHDFRKKKLLNTKVSFYLLYKLCLQHFLF